MSEPMTAKRLMIYLGESDTWRGHSLYRSILDGLRKGGIAGATVTRAIAGFGAHSRIRTDAIEALSADLPIVISVIDTPDKISHALTLIEPMVREGLITIEDVQIVKNTYRELHLLQADQPVSSLMTHNVTAVRAETPAREVVELLLGQRFKAVPVVDNERHVLGIISTTDLLEKAGMPARLAVGERLAASDRDAFLAPINARTAQDIMTAPAVMVRDSEALGYAVQRMVQRNLKRMPVVDEHECLIGMISRLDVLRAVAGSSAGLPELSPAFHSGQTIGEVMSPEVPAVHSNDELGAVLQKLVQTPIQRVVVLDERDRPIGVITDGDLVARVEPAARLNILQALAARITRVELRHSHLTAHELMSREVLSAPAQTPLVAAIALMMREKRKVLVVIDADDKPIGMV